MLLIFALSIPLLLYIFIPIKRKHRYFLAFLICISIFLLFLPSLRLNHLLSKSGIPSVGILTKKNCDVQNDPHIEYRFTANQKEISGAGRPGKGNQRCENLKIGDQVFITYIPGEEAVNVPEREVKSNAFLYTAGCVVLYFFLLWIGNEQEKFRNKK